MSLFFIAFSVLFILIWLISRKALIELLLDPLIFSSKYIFIYDFMLLGSTVISVLVRMNLIETNWIVTNSLRVHYVLMGVSWLLCLLYTVKIFIKRFPNKKKDLFIDQRRQFLKKNVALGGIGVVVGATTVGAVQAIDPKLESLDIKVDEKYKKLAGLKIAQLSDIHIGPTLKKSFFDSLVDQTNELDADIVVITGDMVDGTVRGLKDELTALSKFKSKLGVYYITGNHEYYWNGIEWINFVKSKNVHVFENNSVTLRYNEEDFHLGS